MNSNTKEFVLYPVLLSLHDAVVGNGFVAMVHIEGRSLMRQEEDGFWIDGVNPGALAEGGSTRDEALLKFRESYREVLADMAVCAASFDEFRAEVERFFYQETPGEAEAWLAAAAALRKDRSIADDWLPVSSSYPDASVNVLLLDARDDLEPQKNSREPAVLASAAA